MQTGSQPDAGEPALVTALIAPLVKLRAGLGDGARPADTGMSAMSALPGTVRASDDVHRGGLTPLADTETAAAAVPVIKKTSSEVAALGDVAPAFAPLLTSAYGVRDKAATALDTLISDFRTQATPLVNSARSQADLDAVVALAADHLQSGVGVVKAADGEMDALTSQLKQDQPKVTTPGQPGLATPATGQPGLVQPADDQQQPGTGTGVGTQYPNPGATQPNPSTSQPAAGTNPQNGNYNGYTGNTGSGTGGDVASQLAQSNPQLAAQLAIQTALLSTASTLGSALITAATTLGTSLITAGAQVITTGIEKGETYAEKALAANTSQQISGTTPGTTGQPAATTPGAGTPNLTPGLADPTPSPAQPAAGTPQPAATTPGPSVQPPATQSPAGQPQAGAPDNGGPVVPPITGKPQPGNDDTKRRDGQQGVIPAPTSTT
ncbi:hypothetical protein ACFXHA_43365 [Nocardia sp. NPDC059240]|uniref:hypothetical protein n=1 Tax=Nocardia sp. NPDC059240 TaxID=3346786 RepID=UPI0036CD8F59